MSSVYFFFFFFFQAEDGIRDLTVTGVQTCALPISRRKALVLMSDMIEDTPEYNFEKIAWSPSAVEKLVAELEAKALVPKLPGVCVYVSGASAASAALAENIARFWEAYFRRTGADMHQSRYAHVLLHWPPSQSCRQQ